MVDSYSVKLAEKGLLISVSKRYFESTVRERNISHANDHEILNAIERAMDRKREKAKGYNHKRNQFDVPVLTVSPVDKSSVKRGECREYSFELRKLFRVHIGKEPRETVYTEEKILSKIENRILRILKKAEKNSPEKLSKDNFTDVVRYTLAGKYGYKKHILGKEMFTWEYIIDGIAVALAIGMIITLSLIGKGL